MFCSGSRFWRFPIAHLQPWRHTVVTRDPRALFPTGRSFGGLALFWMKQHATLNGIQRIHENTVVFPPVHDATHKIILDISSIALWNFHNVLDRHQGWVLPHKNPSFWGVNCTLRVAPTRHSGRIIPSRSAAGAYVRNRAPRHHHAGHRCSCRLPKIPRPGPRAEQ